MKLLTVRVLVMSTLVICGGGEAVFSQPFVPFKISNQSMWASDPRTDSRFVVWRSDDLTNGVNVRGRDLLLGRDIEVATGPREQSSPAISNGIVVWEEWQTDVSGAGRIRGRDLNTGGEEFAVSGAQGAQYWPKISGDVVAWTDERDVEQRIYARRLNQPPGSEFAVSTARGIFPDVSGDLVIWNAVASHGGDIYGRRLSGGGVFPISTDPVHKINVQVSGNWVVWQDTTGGSWIWAKNLASGSQFRVSGQSVHAEAPAIDGDLVVWRQSRQDPFTTDIWGRYLSGGDPFQITDTPLLWEGSPDVSGNLVVFQRETEIWGTVVPEPAMVGVFLMSSALMLMRRRRAL